MLTIILILSIFEGCTSPNHIEGSYTNVFFGVAGDEFKFSEEPKKFEYYSRTEGVLRAYSSGTWKQDKRSLFLRGYDNKNINVLDVESTVKNNPNENRDEIVVQYKDNHSDTFTKVDVVINGNLQIRIPGDTAFFVDAGVRTLRVKSYLAHEGLLLATPPVIDTLYSLEIKMADPGKYKSILLKPKVDEKDFYRVKFTDTLTLKNRRTLLWHNKQFKKLKE